MDWKYIFVNAYVDGQHLCNLRYKGKLNVNPFSVAKHFFYRQQLFESKFYHEKYLYNNKKWIYNNF
jgi:hypothetical protein